MGISKGREITSGLIRTVGVAVTRTRRLATWFITPQVQPQPLPLMTHLRLVRGSGSGVTDGYTKAVAASHPSILPPLDPPAFHLVTGTSLRFGTSRSEMFGRQQELREVTDRQRAIATPSTSRLSTVEMGRSLIEEYGITSSDLELHFIRCSLGLSARLDIAHGPPERSTPNGA